MGTNPSGRLLGVPEKPRLRFGESFLHAEWFDLETVQDYSAHRRYNRQQGSRYGGPSLDGVWFRMDAFVNRKPPGTMSVKLWAGR